MPPAAMKSEGTETLVVRATAVVEASLPKESH
jgi:hypothetical protein